MKVRIEAIESAEEERALLGVSRERDATGSQSTMVLIWWGSDCRACGNTTPDAMFCDECGSNDHTLPLFMPRETPR